MTDFSINIQISVEFMIGFIGYTLSCIPTVSSISCLSENDFLTTRGDIGVYVVMESGVILPVDYVNRELRSH